jgi:DNA polymerase-4
MGGARARRLCPQAIVVPPRFSAYVEASRALFEVFEGMAPRVEGLSLEEAFLDVSGLERISGSPREIAARLKRDVRDRVGLPITVGIARTKSLAKVASAEAKPDGLLVVPPDGELEFLHPLPVERLWGAGPKTTARLHHAGIVTVGELARLSENELIEIIGRARGRHLHALARSRDPRPVRRRRGRGSFGSQSALGRSWRSSEALDGVLIGLVERVTRRMRAAERVGRTVVLRLRFDDYTRATRSHTLEHPTSASITVLTSARSLLGAAMPTIRRRGLTLLGIAVANLDGRGVGVQLTLPIDHRPRDRLDAALDEIRNRFGTEAVTRAALLGRSQTLSAWLLPGDAPDP